MVHGEARVLPRLTILAASGDAAQLGLAGRLAQAFAHGLRTRVVTPAVLIGRDLLEAERILWLDHRLASALPHWRELLLQARARTLIVVGSDALGDATAVRELRRFAGRALCRDAAVAAWLQPELLAPVDCLDADVIRGIAVALQQPEGCGDDVDSHLQQALQWLQRGCDEGAFLAAARALKLEPDQPGIVADVARLLVKLGRREQAEATCVIYLRQRPQSAPVLAALREVRALQPA